MADIWITMHHPVTGRYAYATLAAFNAQWEADGWTNVGLGHPGEYIGTDPPSDTSNTLIVLGTPDDGDVPRFESDQHAAVWEPALRDSDLAALTGQPRDVPGLRSLDEIVAWFESQGYTRSSFFALLDRFNAGQDLRGDMYVSLGAGRGVVAIPAAVWTAALGAYNGSSLKTFIEGTGGDQSLTVTLPALALAREGVLYTGKPGSVLTASGGAAPYTWSIVSGQLPLDTAGSGARLQLVPSGGSAGAITGTPAQTPSTDGVYDLTFRVTDVLGRTADATLPLTVLDAGAPLNFTLPPTLPSAQATTPYATDVSGYAGGGSPPRTYSVAPGSTLPDGLSLTSAGVISGTPTTSGAATFTIRCVDNVGAVADSTSSLLIADAPSSILATARDVAPLTDGMETLTPIATDDVVLPNERFLVGISTEPESFDLPRTLANKKRNVIDAETAYLGNGQAFDIDRLFLMWGDKIDQAGGTTIANAYARWSAARGRIVWVNVRALRSNDGSVVPWGRIADASGPEDATIDSMATAVASLGARMIFCFHHEPELHVVGTVREAWNASHTYAVNDVVTTGTGPSLRYFTCIVAVNPASATNPSADAAHWSEMWGTATEYKAAWARIRARFDAAGVDNVAYMFNAGCGAWNLATSDARHPSKLIPPGTVIDWASANPFNFSYTMPGASTKSETTTWCPSFMAWKVPYTPTKNDVRALAKRTNIIVDQSRITAHVATAHAENPDCQVINYIWPTFGLGQQKGGAGTPYDVSWFMHKTNTAPSNGDANHTGSTRIYRFDGGVPNPFPMMDIESLGWMGKCLDDAYNFITVNGYKGIILDVMGGVPFDGSTVAVNTTSNVCTLNAHDWVDGQAIIFTAVGNLTNVSPYVVYYLRDVTVNTFKLAAFPGDTAIDIGGSGTLTVPGLIDVNAVPTLPVHKTAKTTAGDADRTWAAGSFWTKAQWMAACVDWVSLFKSLLDARVGRSILVVPNGIKDGLAYMQSSTPPNATSTAPLANVGSKTAMCENFGRVSAGNIDTFVAESAVRANMFMLETASAAGQRLLNITKIWTTDPATGPAPDPAKVERHLTYHYATFLMGSDGVHEFAFTDVQNWVGLTKRLGIEDIDLGLPLGPFEVVDASGNAVAGRPAATGLYRREFERGTVLLNPIAPVSPATDNPKSTTLRASMYEANATTGKVTGAPTTSVTLSSNTAKIFLTVPSMAGWTSFQSLLDGGANGFYQWVPANRAGVQMMVGAWGCIEDPTDDTRRAAWIVDMADKIKNTYPLIRGAVLHDNPSDQARPTAASNWTLRGRYAQALSTLAMKVWTLQNRAPGRSSFPATGRSWYVSAAELRTGATNPARGYDTQGTGANQGDGSSAHPYATITKAMTQASAGDVIVCRNGIYRESINYTKNVHVSAQRGHFAFLSGSDRFTLTPTPHPDLPGVTVFATPFNAATLNRKHTTGRKTTIAATSDAQTVDATPRVVNVASTAAVSPWPDWNAGTLRRAVVTRVISGTRTVIGELAYVDATIGAPGTLNGCTAVGASFALATGDQVGGGNSVPFAFADEFAQQTPMAGFPDQVYIGGKQLTQVARRQDVVPGTSTFWLDVTATGTTTLWVSDDPAGRMVEITTRPTAWTGNGGGGPNVSAGHDVETCGLGFVHFGTTLNPSPQESATMIVANLKRWSFRSCLWSRNAAGGVAVYGGYGHEIDNSLGVHMGALAGKANAIAGAGALLALLVRRSRFDRNNWSQFDAGASSYASMAAWKISQADAVAFLDTNVDDNLCTAIWYDVLCTRPYMVNTRTRRNLQSGHYVEISTGATLVNIVATDNGYAGVKMVDPASSAAGTEPVVWGVTAAKNGSDSSGQSTGRAEVFLYDDPRTAVGPTPVLAERVQIGNAVLVAGQTNLETLLKLLDGNSAVALSAKPLIPQSAAVTFSLSNGHSFKATCTTSSAQLTVTSWDTLVPSDVGLVITGPAGTLPAGTTLVTPGKSNSALRMLSGGLVKVLFTRLTGMSSKPIAKLPVTGGGTATPTSVAALDTALGQTTNAVIWTPATSTMYDVFIDPDHGDYRLTTVAIKLVPPDPIPQVALDRLNAAFGVNVESFTPDQVGAYDDLGRALGFGVPLP